jgi:hypothetical protein
MSKRNEGGGRRRFTRGDPCPVCGTGTKGCSRQDDGLHYCRGTKANKGQTVNGYRCQGPDKNGEFLLFRQPSERRRDGPRPNGRPNGQPDPPPPSDWPARHEAARNRLAGHHLDALAEALGVPAAGLSLLEPGVEWFGPPHDPQRVFVFPMRDGAGRVCGLHGRWPDGAKRALTGSSLAPFAPAGWKDSDGPLIIPEGASDVGAGCALGLPCVGRPSAKAGLQALADLLAGTEREVVVLGEFDPKDDGDWPGRDGAVATARKLAAALRRPIDWAFPPGQAKDLRAWFAARGLTATSLADECHAAGEEFMAGLKRNTVEPPAGGEEDPELIQTEDDIPTLADARAAGASKRWLWLGWIQADVLNGLAGEFGHGKTRLVAELIRRVRAGEPWPDGGAMTLPPGSRFLFIPADYQHAELCDLAEQYGFPEGCIYINSMKDAPDGVSLFDSPQALACLERRIAILRPALVIVDPVTATTTADRAHNLAEGGTALYGPLQRLARKFGVTFLILIHLNREGGTYGRHAKGKFRTQITLTKVDVEGDERYRLEVSKSNSKSPDALGASQRDSRWDFDHNPPEKEPGPRKSGPRPSADAQAVKFLRDYLGLHEKKLVEVVDAWMKAGHSKRTIFAAAKRMQEDGELLTGETESPSGKRLKTWQMAPPRSAGSDNGTLFAGAANGEAEGAP